MHDTISMRKSRPLLGALACGLLTCLAAPPIRGAGSAGDGGGCNGGRSLQDGAGDGATSAEGTSTTETMTESESGSSGSGGVCGDGVMDAGEGV